MTAGLGFAPSFLWLPLVGGVIGLLVTVFGGGGGFLYVPILTLLFHVPTQQAAATSLAATIPTLVVGSIGHYRRGNIDLRTGLVFGIAGFLGALVGSVLSGHVSSESLGKMFGVYAIALTIPMVLTSRSRLKKLSSGEKKSRSLTTSGTLLGSFFGLVSGVMAGFFGTSGTASVVAGLYVLDLPITVVVGTSVFVVFLNALSGFAGHLLVGHFDLTLLALLGSGSVVGGFVGPRLLARMNVEVLEKVYGLLFILVVVVLGVAMFLKK
jgi:uncharacterized membrane protein YfcA